MTKHDREFNRKLTLLLRDFERRMRAAVSGAQTEREQRKRAKEVKREWKEAHGTYYVGTYTVHAHFRRIPRRAAVRGAQAAR
jgi:hypothetical protein